ncbi:MAG TPA: SURF1 family protein [Steroidobacter sp.]|uniref:SURF1 family protein n=1 Tax=Steroidobacter sp. TaxID=1978227 RepID=UPI002ED9CF90
MPGATRPLLKLTAIVIAGLAGVATLVSLGVWQVHRLAWKRDLIERVEQRVHAPAVAAPGREQWPQVNVANSEYRHVSVQGHYLHDRETLVQAVTERGGGFWVLTPLQTADGHVVMVNRGFVPPNRRDPATRQEGQIEGLTTVTGLLRISESGGAYLRSNEPAADRWYSRDVAAIAAARGLADVAPYFIDADATANEARAGNAPVGGLTVIRFSNNHLQYALTWFALASMVAAGTFLVLRHEWRSRKLPAS